MTEPENEVEHAFYGHMDRRWDADPCAPVDYYDPDASLTFPEALRLCRYAADYERRGGVVPEDARRHFRGLLEAARPAARQVDALFERLQGENAPCLHEERSVASRGQSMTINSRRWLAFLCWQASAVSLPA